MINRIMPLEDLREGTMKYAKRLALIGPETLYATKLSISRGADAAGFRNAIQAGVDIVAPLYATKTAVRAKFEEIIQESGLKKALAWRKSQFEG
jgi:enoyl-CoA hydratase